MVDSAQASYENAQLQAAAEKYKNIPEYQLAAGLKSGSIQVSPSEVREYVNKLYPTEKERSTSSHYVEVYNKSVEISNAGNQVTEVKGQFKVAGESNSISSTVSSKDIESGKYIPISVESVTTKAGDVVPVNAQAQVTYTAQYGASGPLWKQTEYKLDQEGIKVEAKEVEAYSYTKTYAPQITGNTQSSQNIFIDQSIPSISVKPNIGVSTREELIPQGKQTFFVEEKITPFATINYSTATSFKEFVPFSAKPSINSSEIFAEQKKAELTSQGLGWMYYTPKEVGKMEVKLQDPTGYTQWSEKGINEFATTAQTGYTKMTGSPFVGDVAYGIGSGLGYLTVGLPNLAKGTAEFTLTTFKHPEYIIPVGQAWATGVVEHPGIMVGTSISAYALGGAIADIGTRNPKVVSQSFVETKPIQNEKMEYVFRSYGDVKTAFGHENFYAKGLGEVKQFESSLDVGTASARAEVFPFDTTTGKVLEPVGEIKTTGATIVTDIKPSLGFGDKYAVSIGTTSQAPFVSDRFIYNQQYSRPTYNTLLVDYGTTAKEVGMRFETPKDFFIYAKETQTPFMSVTYIKEMPAHATTAKYIQSPAPIVKTPFSVTFGEEGASQVQVQSSSLSSSVGTVSSQAFANLAKAQTTSRVTSSTTLSSISLPTASASSSSSSSEVKISSSPSISISSISSQKGSSFVSMKPIESFSVKQSASTSLSSSLKFDSAQMNSKVINEKVTSSMKGMENMKLSSLIQTSQSTKLAEKTQLNYSYKFQPGQIPPPPPEQKPSTIPFFGFTPSKQSGKAPSMPNLSRMFKYSVSYTARVLNIKGKAPKGMISPFKLRPIPFWGKRGKRK